MLVSLNVVSQWFVIKDLKTWFAGHWPLGFLTFLFAFTQLQKINYESTSEMCVRSDPVESEDESILFTYSNILLTYFYVQTEHLTLQFSTTSIKSK